MDRQKDSVLPDLSSLDDERLEETLRALAEDLKKNRQSLGELSWLVRKILESLRPGRRRIPRRELKAALSDHRGIVSRSAAELKISDGRLRSLMDRYGLKRTDYTGERRAIPRPELEAALRANGGNMAATSRELSVTPAAVSQLMCRYGLKCTDYIEAPRTIPRPDIEAALRANGGNVLATARELSVTPAIFGRLICSYGLKRTDYTGERRAIPRLELEAALKTNHGDLSNTARELSVTRAAVIRLMRSYGLRRADYTDAPRSIPRPELEAALRANGGNMAATARGLSVTPMVFNRLMCNYGLKRTDYIGAPRTISGPDIEAALRANGGNMSATARELSVTPAVFARLMGRYGLKRTGCAGERRTIPRPELEAALRVNGGNVSETARRLKTNRRQIQRLINRYGLRRADYVNAPETSGPRIPETQ